MPTTTRYMQASLTAFVKVCDYNQKRVLLRVSIASLSPAYGIGVYFCKNPSEGSMIDFLPGIYAATDIRSSITLKASEGWDTTEEYWVQGTGAGAGPYIIITEVLVSQAAMDKLEQKGITNAFDAAVLPLLALAVMT